jgi:hypothetical protein
MAEMTCRMAGRRGGMATLAKHGKVHFARAGRLGIVAMRQQRANPATPVTTGVPSGAKS